MPQRLTQTIVNRLAQGEPTVVRDETVKGLLVIVNKRSASFAIQRDLYQGRHGQRKLVKTVRRTLGRVGEMTLDEARTDAMSIIAQIKRGHDPNAARAEPGADGWTIRQLWDAYAADLAAREASPATLADFEDVGARYLGDLMPLPLVGLKRSICRDRHWLITKKHGPIAANRCFRSLRAAYNFALRTVDNPDDLPANPVVAVTWNKERSRDTVIMPEALPDWYKQLRELPNPLRQEMHLLGLLSGLRPGNLAAIRREWIDLDNRTIHIPRTKSGRPFDLPLSEPMVECVERTLEVADVLHPGAPWLFTTRDRVGVRCATKVWREKTIPTGHVLRHSYRTLAHAAGVASTDVQLLMDHKVNGITGVYLHDRALFQHLLGEQQRVSKHVMGLLSA